MMRVIVCCKGIPKDPANVGLTEDRRGLRFEAPALIINESDEYAIDEAVLLKKKIGARVTAVALGPLASQEVLYLALAKGADEAVRVDSRAWSPPEVALLLAKVVEKKGADLVFSGVQSADRMASLVGGLLAAALGWPFVFAATAVEASGEKSIAVERELGEGKVQRLEVDLPAVLAVQSGICPLTYAPPVRRLQARQKPIEVFDPGRLGLAPDLLERFGGEEIEALDRPPAGQSAAILEGTPQEIAKMILSKMREVT